MEPKFKIKFVLGKEMTDNLLNLRAISKFETEICKEGWILLEIGNSTYGWLPSSESADGDELLDLWFKSLKNVYLQLQNKSKVILNYWENPLKFFIFTKDSGDVAIQYYERILPVENGTYQNSIVYEIKLLAETIVLENEFFNTIKQVVNNFWDEINKLNPIISTYTEQFYIKDNILY